MEDPSKSFDLVFSRNKMLRRKIKRRKMATATVSSEAAEEADGI